MQNEFDDENVPAANMVKTVSGNEIDVNNVPGKVKMSLIQEGEIKSDTFVSSGDMPGKKLAELRKAHAERFTETPTETNPYKVGDIILFKEKSYEVLKVDQTRVMFFRNGKDVWVNHMKVKKG